MQILIHSMAMGRHCGLYQEWTALAMLSPGSLWLIYKKKKESKGAGGVPVRRSLQ